MDEGFPERLRQHGALRGTALLLEKNQRLVELRIAFLDLFPQNIGLRMLASQTQHGCSRDVGMMEVPGDQAAEISRVLARAAAAALMGEKLYAVDVLEQTA